jgi:hypothetical protein
MSTVFPSFDQAPHVHIIFRSQDQKKLEDLEFPEFDKFWTEHTLLLKSKNPCFTDEWQKSLLLESVCKELSDNGYVMKIESLRDPKKPGIWKNQEQIYFYPGEAASPQFASRLS